MQRRRFLETTAASVVASGCTPEALDPFGPGSDPRAPTGDTGLAPAPPPEPGPEPGQVWEPDVPIDESVFRCGVQTGDAQATSVVVSCRPGAGSRLHLWLARGTDQGWQRVRVVDDLEVVDAVAQIELGDLEPDTAWAVVVLTADRSRRSAASRFRTALHPGTRRVVRIGAVSCLGAARAPWPVLARAAEARLDAFLLLGDTIYADDGDRALDDWDGHWANCLQMSGMRALTASTSVIATWDDHEVDDNWSWDQPGMPDLAWDALDAFRRHIPQRTGPNGGLWRKLTWGETLELFVLDCRTERIDGAYLSPEQRAWLEEGLRQSTARFKLILNSVPITDMDSVYFGIGAEDRWDGHPDDRTPVLELVRDIPGALWVSGDFHWGAVARVDPEPDQPGFDQFEVFAGPGGSPINPVAFLVPTSARYPVVVSEHNAVLIDADPDEGTLDIRFIDADGATIDHITLAR